MILYTAIVAIWVLALAAVFGAGGLLAWSAGVVYVAYDTLLLVFVALEMRWLWRKTPARANAGRRPSIGVIVAAYNEAGVIASTIGALQAQTDAPGAHLFADDGSTDGTAELLAPTIPTGAPVLGEFSSASPLAPHCAGCGCRISARRRR